MSATASLSDRFFIVPARLEGDVSSPVHASDLWSIPGDQWGDSTPLPSCTVRSRDNETPGDTPTTFYSAQSLIGDGGQLQRYPQRPGASTSLLPVIEGNGETEEMREIPLQRVFRLKGGEIFAGRYRIQRRMPRAPLQFYADDVMNGEKVVLKFYPWPYHGLSNSIAKYERLRHNDLVCKIIELIKEDEQFPPCLVMESGESTLCSLLGQTGLPPAIGSILARNVFRALNSLHERDIVHANLGPDNFMWFLPDFTCKIIDFDAARFSGEEAVAEIPLSTMALLQYAAPEVIRSANRGKKLRFDTTCDIWSAGILAHELFTGKQYYGELSSAEYIVEVAASREPLPEIDCKDRRMRSFLQRALRMDPSKRPMASIALEHDVFRSTDASLLKQVEMRELLDRMYHLEGAFHAHLGGAMASQLNSTVTLEVFGNERTARDPFEKSAAKEALFGSDDELDGAGVFYILKIGESCRVRIAIQYDPNLRVRIREISSVHLKAPDSEPIELEKQMVVNDGRKCEIMTLMDPTRIRSNRLRVPCPVFGPSEQRYVRMELRLEFETRGDVSDQRLELNHVFHGKMVWPQSRLLFHRLAGSFRRRWRTMPRWIRRTTQGVVCCAKVGALAI